MPKIITTSDLQKNIGNVTKEVENNFFIVTNRGRARMVIMPFFEENDLQVEEYLEEYEIQKNKTKLEKKHKTSLRSGLSRLKV